MKSDVVVVLVIVLVAALLVWNRHRIKRREEQLQDSSETN